MPTIRKIRTVVRSKDAPVETDYVIVSVKHVKGTCPGSPEYATLPIKYYFDNERPKCINTINKIITKNELSIHFVEKYNFLDKSPLIKHIEREIIRKHGDNIFRDEEFEQFCLNKK